MCINYGLAKAPAATCLRLYGFMPPEGQGTVSVELYAEMSPGAEAFDKKSKYALVLAGRQKPLCATGLLFAVG